MCFKCQNYEKRWALHKNDISKIINILKNASFLQLSQLKLIFEHFIAGSNFICGFFCSKLYLSLGA
jgi:hypothetical protein